jgi:hypothetical protein
MIYNIITPAKRTWNFQSLIDALKPQNVQWHLICDAEDFEKYDSSENWIHRHVHNINLDRNGPHYTRVYLLVNWFLDNVGVKEDQMYQYLTDDDSIEPNFYSKIDNAINTIDGETANLVIVSMDRGQRCPDDNEYKYGAFKEIASAEEIEAHGVAFERYIFKGCLVKDHRFPTDTLFGDSIFSQQLFLQNREKTIILPDNFVWFNYLQPGRWDK